MLLLLLEALAKTGTPQSVGRWVRQVTIKFRISRRWWINEMEDCCSRKSHNTRTKWHWVKLAGEKRKRKALWEPTATRVVEAGPKGRNKVMCIKGICKERRRNVPANIPGSGCWGSMGARTAESGALTRPFPQQCLLYHRYIYNTRLNGPLV